MKAKMIPTTQSWRLLLLLLSFFLFQLSCAVDTLSSGQSLTSNQTLVSRDGTFALGFFSPGTSPYSYLAIWYNRISTQNKTSVWVANRNSPLPDASSSRFTLTPDGNLVVTNALGIPVWSTNLTLRVTGNTTEAVLGDDGNLILRDGASPGDIHWQSFDHPGNTWLPGGRLRYDNITRRPVLLTSWKNENDPAEGLFSLELVPTTAEYIIRWNRTVQYWTSGPWNGQIFSGVPEMTSNYYYNFTYVTRPNESYFIYNVYDRSVTTSTFVMALSGQIQVSTWNADTQQWFLFWSQPRQQCQVYAYCGAFGVCNQNQQPYCRCLSDSFQPRSPTDWNMSDFSTGGCARRTPLQCRDRVGFSQVSNVNLPVNPQTLTAGSARECESACLNNCNCSAYAYNGGCLVWNGDLLDLQISNANEAGSDLYLRVAASDVQTPGGNGKGSNTGIIAGASAGAIVLLGLILFVVWRRRARRSNRKSSTIEGSLVAFTYRDLQSATKNFSEKLGSGGFGSVFKGTLPDSTAIAVKKLEGLGQGEKQFRTEVSTIGTIQHVNLVRLRGFCSEGDKRLLVYDHMPNGSLDYHMFNEQGSKILTWKHRYQIALGTARGLHYLHEKCRDCIIHCDIKPENILLDAEMYPKVADFGLAKLIGRDFSRVLTTMRGTRGYLAPEWISGVAITPKADVYSYGMMLFEIISGKRNSEHSIDGKTTFFPTWAAKQVTENGDVLVLLDPELKGEVNVEELKRACRVACWCIQDDELNRPSMGQVVQILEGVMEVNLPPVPRTLQALGETEENIHFFSESSSNRSSQVRSSTSGSSQAKSNISSASSKS